MKTNSRRSGAKIMASLIVLLGSLAYVMLLAVIYGSLGFICAMGVTLCSAVGIAKALGETLAVSYGLIMALAIGCGVLRGLLRYVELYTNHYMKNSKLDQFGLYFFKKYYFCIFSFGL